MCPRYAFPYLIYVLGVDLGRSLDAERSQPLLLSHRTTLGGSPDERVRGALSTASLEEAPFGSLRLCGEGYGESRALQILDDYLSMDEVEFARCGLSPSRSMFLQYGRCLSQVVFAAETHGDA